MIWKWKRPTAFLLAAAMIVTMSGVPASAVEPDVSAASGSAPAECSCETHCEQGAVNPDCPVCGIEGADLTQCQSEANAITVEKVQELIDALPTTDKLTTMTKDEQNAVYADLQAAYEAYQALTEDEQALLTGTEVFESLFHFFMVWSIYWRRTAFPIWTKTAMNRQQRMSLWWKAAQPHGVTAGM